MILLKLVLPKSPLRLSPYWPFYLSAYANQFATPPNKKTPALSCQGLCAQNWIRTSTSLRTLRPEHSASTNFAIWAFNQEIVRILYLSLILNTSLLFLPYSCQVLARNIKEQKACMLSSICLLHYYVPTNAFSGHLWVQHKYSSWSNFLSHTHKTYKELAATNPACRQAGSPSGH